MADTVDAERRKSTAPSGTDRTPDASKATTPTAPGGLAVTPDDPARRTALGQLAVQRKAAIGAASDPLEREADRAADHVMRAIDPAAPSRAQPAQQVQQAQPAQPVPATPAAPMQRQVAPASAAQPPRTEDASHAASTRPIAEHAAEPATDRTQALIDASAGRGEELPAATRLAMESSFGRDLSAVRVHDDEAAHEAAASIGALAFTRGSDVYFAAGMYDPVGESGRRLLAHELAHVVQQDAAPESGPVRRSPAPTLSRTPDSRTTLRRVPRGGGGGAAAAPPTGPSWTDSRGNKIDTATKTVELVNVAIPQVKIATIGAPATVRKREDRQARPSTESYTALWSTAAKAALQPRLTTLLQSRTGTNARGANGVYYLRYGQTAAAPADARLVPFLGREADLAEGLWRPLWEKGQGNFAQFDIDHKKDWSLGGANTIDNLWLLERRANQRLGGLVWTPVSTALDTFLTAARPHLSPKPTPDTVDRQYTVVVKSWRPSGAAVPGHPTWNWSATDMGTENITKYLRAVTGRQRTLLTGTPTSLAIFSRQFGRSQRQLPFNGPGRSDVSNWGTNGLYRVTAVQIDRVDTAVTPGSQVGYLVVDPFHGNQYVTGQQLQLPIIGMAGVLYGGAVSAESARGRIGAAFRHASPIEFAGLEFDVVHGFEARGVIRPTLPLLRNAELAVILGDDIVIEATLSAGDFTLPGPLQITNGMVVARIGIREPASVTGSLGIEIKDLAQGSIRIGYTTTDGFAFHGRLGSLPDKPYTAEVEVGYERGAWSARGTVAVGPGKITGIRRGSATVSLAGERISAEGEFESSFRGLTGGRLAFTQDPVTGTTVAGSLTLGRLPGIEGGEIAARVQQRADGAGWSLAGSVTARPAIPGVTGSITGHYEDGAFAAEADLGYHRGMLDGRLRLGVTNQAVGADGRPAGPPVPDHMTVFGRGSLALQLTPWLIGTAIVEVRPNGTIAVAGRIGLPDNFTLFDRRELNRRLFSIGIDIPIVGIAVAGQRVGIFATVSGGLDLVAGIGPGQLLGSGITVSYDPDREDATTLEGETHLVVPADAGLRLFIRGGVGAGIPLVSAEAGVELGAELGLAGRLTADAHLMWTRSQGLVFDAEAGLTVQPRFRFTADLFAVVSIGIGWLSKDIYDEHWRLAAFEYGSDLRFGVFLPMHAEAGRFDFSFDRMRFEYPSIDPGEIAMGAIRHIVG